MLSTVNSLIYAVRTSLCLAASESLQLKQAPVGTKWLGKSRKTFLLHSQINFALHEDWQNPEKLFLPSKRFAALYPMEKEFVKKWSVPLLDPVISCPQQAPHCSC